MRTPPLLLIALSIVATLATAPMKSVRAQAQAQAPAQAEEKTPSPSPPVFKRYNLRCLAPLLGDLDPDAPKTLEQAFLAGPVGLADPLSGDAATAAIGAGAVRFPITSDAPDAQVLFNQGVALLHTLWYREAERAFRSVVHLDPDCAMGYWGLAMANEVRPGRARLFAETAVTKINANHPPLERRWIDILARYHGILQGTESAAAPPAAPPADATGNDGDSPDSAGDLTARSTARIRALEDLVIDFPDSIEAKAFLLRQLTLDEYRAGVPITAHLGVERLAADLAEAAPRHPSRHYLVFLWLDRRPQRGLAYADAAPTLSPGTAEVWRYSGEAYAAADRANEAIPFFEAALRVDHRRMEEELLMPWETQNLASNYEVLIETLASMGRIDEALAYSRRAARLPRAADPSSDIPSLAYRLYPEVRMRAEQWEELLADFDSSPLIQSAMAVEDRAPMLFWKGIASLFLERDAGVMEASRELDELLLTALREGVSNRVERTVTASGEALDACRELFGADSPVPIAPSKTPPLITPALLALAYEKSGLFVEAAAVARADAKARPGGLLPIASNCYRSYVAGNKKEAFFQFDRRFRANASFADESLVALERLAPLARELKLPDPWVLRVDPPVSDALPSDPSSLGPAAWTPPPGPAFSIPDHTGRNHGLADFAGKPVLLNFFLGISCAFCLEQLEVFKPHLQAFRDAGIQFVAVSSDPLVMLQHAFGNRPEKKDGAEAEFPFPVLADPDLEVFRSYLAYDDFEGGPMHATVLLDANGRILWANRAHKPFKEPLALLREAQRLLRLHHPR